MHCSGVGDRSASEMGERDGSAGSVSVLSGKMVFEPILEEGVFRFDCSPEDRSKAFPSVSFADPKGREVLIMTHKVPEFVPEFTCQHGGLQTVTIQVNSIFSSFGLFV